MKLSFRAYLALILCKLLRILSRVLHRGGTAMPGRFAMKVCPDLLSRLSSGVKSVVVTGTNGKTTCSRMIEEAFSQKEELSDQELEELALEAHSDEV